MARQSIRRQFWAGISLLCLYRHACEDWESCNYRGRGFPYMGKKWLIVLGCQCQQQQSKKQGQVTDYGNPWLATRKIGMRITSKSRPTWFPSISDHKWILVLPETLAWCLHCIFHWLLTQWFASSSSLVKKRGLNMEKSRDKTKQAAEQGVWYERDACPCKFNVLGCCWYMSPCRNELAARFLVQRFIHGITFDLEFFGLFPRLKHQCSGNKFNSDSSSGRVKSSGIRL